LPIFIADISSQAACDYPPMPAPPLAPLRRIGDLAVADFMRTHWQRRPLLVRGLFAPAAFAAIDRAALARLASRDDVESRLVRRVRARWSVAHGPFGRADLPSPGTHRWTLLVQGIEGHLRAAADLLARFRFLSDARLDDVMASYASEGGGVGPHVDSYDVFLVQTSGRRRWRISRQRDTRFMPGQPLKILADFRPTQDWVLHPGDALYLPPGFAHDGVAVPGDGDCITCSVGFRAPAWRELVDPCLDAVGDSLARAPRLAGRYADPGAPVVGARGAGGAARLPRAMLDALLQRFAPLPLGRDAATRVLLAHLSEPKPHVVFERPSRALTSARLAAVAAQRGVAADLRTRCLHAGRWFGINGDTLPLPAGAGAALRRFADRRRLSGAEATAWLRTAAAPLLHEWYVAGWLHPGEAPSTRWKNRDAP
jgi:50S ribosomal protein L16 3-hydroxylase